MVRFLRDSPKKKYGSGRRGADESTSLPEISFRYLVGGCPAFFNSNYDVRLDVVSADPGGFVRMRTYTRRATRDDRWEQKR
jgi:hypothetical protein